MEDPRKSFAGALRDLVGLYNDLVALLDQESDATVKRDVVALGKLARGEETLLENIRNAESRRARYLTMLGNSIGLQTKGMSLKEVAELAGEQFRGTFLKLRAELQDVAQRLASKTKLKMLLCKNSLDHIHAVICLLGGGYDTGTYTPEGMRRSEAGQLMIDQKA